MTFFLVSNDKTLSLTWSKKNLIGPEALHQDPRPKIQDPSPRPRPRRAEPSRPDGGGGARVGALSLSLSRLNKVNLCYTLGPWWLHFVTNLPIWQKCCVVKIIGYLVMRNIDVDRAIGVSFGLEVLWLKAEELCLCYTLGPWWLHFVTNLPFWQKCCVVKIIGYMVMRNIDVDRAIGVSFGLEVLWLKAAELWYMPISTRSNKEELHFFSDPTRLERSIREEKHTSSIDTTSPTSIDTPSTTSIDTCDRATIDNSTRTSIDTNPRADMVATLVLQRDENEDMHDPEGHMCNAAGQKIYGQGTAILEPYAATQDAEVTRQRTLADLIRPISLVEQDVEKDENQDHIQMVKKILKIQQVASDCLNMRYMSISTRSNKEELHFFSDPTRLERSIRKEKHTSSIDTTSPTSIATPSTTSIDTCDRATIDSSTRTSIDSNPRADMVATLVLQRDENEDLHDPEGHMCNAADVEKDENQDHIQMVKKILKIQQVASGCLNMRLDCVYMELTIKYEVVNICKTQGDLKERLS
ncbi:hypothetical protein F2Q69_00052640 [Brassica cretica]|uniref:Uncharacterized protein n=1 Tax=Brassica cretica TaxID=69181 RepID=A0A8S9MT33_BRACR|nr:hypothetical protein F2Q69_00052640 [Brassica cretica]